MDYAALKAISVEQVMSHYGIKLEPRVVTGDEKLCGYCPLCHPNGGSKATNNQFQFTINSPRYPKTNATFHCFSCKARGTLLDFIVLKEGLMPNLSKTEWDDVRVKRHSDPSFNWCPTDKLKEASKILAGIGEGKSVEVSKEVKTVQAPAPSVQLSSNCQVITRNLTWKEKWNGKEPTYSKFAKPNEYLESRGIREELLEEFGIFYYENPGQKNNIRNGTIFIPIWNLQGEIVAFANRFLGDEGKDGQRYLFPNADQFNKSLEVWAIHKAVEEKHVVVTEGFWGCLNLIQHGVNCVSVMGSHLSDQQAELLADHFLETTFLIDPDLPGRTLAVQAIEKLHTRVLLRIVLPSMKADQMDAEQIAGLF